MVCKENKFDHWPTTKRVCSVFFWCAHHIPEFYWPLFLILLKHEQWLGETHIFPFIGLLED